MSEEWSTEGATRFEVIDWRAGHNPARAFVAYGVLVALALQDGGKTLKVFVRDREPRVPTVVQREWDNPDDAVYDLPAKESDDAG